MMFPTPWTPGDPITAARLNIGQAEAERHRRSVSLGRGSSMVFEAMGNQSASMPVPLLKLMVAIEDFSIPAERTDLSVGPDDVPSGLCKQLRLDRNDATHREENVQAGERVWDALGGLNGNALRRCGEVFYIVFNVDSKRWEILQSVSIRLVPGIVRCCIDEGWHEVEICDWADEPPTADCYVEPSVSGSNSGSASGSGSVSASVSDVVAADHPCSPCNYTDVDTDTVCETGSSITVTRNTGTGTGEIVYAHTTRLMPMLVGGMIKMLKRTTPTTTLCGSDSASSSDSISASVSNIDFSDRIYDVVDGVWPIISLPFPVFTCCTDPITGIETVEMTQCNKAVVEGYWCIGPDIGCASASVSGSV